MNPRLVKFAVDLQNVEKVEKDNEKSNFYSGGGKKFLNFFKPAKVAVVVSTIE